jgi:hypothetical protein
MEVKMEAVAGEVQDEAEKALLNTTDCFDNSDKKGEVSR